VVALEAATNRVVVGPAAALLRQEFVVANCNWVGLDTLAGPLPATVKIRYNHRGCRTTLRPLGDGRVMVTAAEPQRAVTPGQAAVFYAGELVLGGGWIEG
jgi:tRNA-specific 2-thiouridylase